MDPQMAYRAATSNCTTAKDLPAGSHFTTPDSSKCPVCKGSRVVKALPMRSKLGHRPLHLAILWLLSFFCSLFHKKMVTPLREVP